MPRPRLLSDADVLAAASRAISAVGPGRLTLADVAREVGLSPATLLQRFGSKRGLLLALAAQAASQLEADFRHSTAADASALGALRSALLRMVSGIASPAEMANHVALLHLDLSDPEFRAYAQAHARAFRAGVVGLLNAAIDAGELLPTNPQRLAQAVQVVYNGTLVSWAIDPEGPLANRLTTELDTLLAPYRVRPAK